MARKINNPIQNKGLRGGRSSQSARKIAAVFLTLIIALPIWAAIRQGVWIRPNGSNGESGMPNPAPNPVTASSAVGSIYNFENGSYINKNFTITVETTVQVDSIIIQMEELFGAYTVHPAENMTYNSAKNRWEYDWIFENDYITWPAGRYLIRFRFIKYGELDTTEYMYAVLPDKMVVEFLTPSNNSYISGSGGTVPFIIEVVTPGRGAEMDPNLPPKMYNGTDWINMSDVSGGSLRLFGTDVDLSDKHGTTAQYLFNVTNDLGNSTLLYLNFTVDNTPPEYSAINAENGLFIGGDYTFKLSAYDNISGITSVKMTIRRLFGDFAVFSPVNMTYNSTSGYWEYTWKVESNDYPEGPYNITFSIKNGAGTESSVTYTVKVDRTYPEFAVIYPLPGSALSDNFVMKFRFSDDISGLSNVYIRINREKVITYPISPDGYYNYTFSISEYGEGELEIEIWGINGVGMKNGTDFTYLIDRSPPEAVVDLPDALSGTAVIGIKAEDTSGFSAVKWSLNGKAYSNLNVSSLSNITLNTLKYPDGYYTFTLLFYDKADPPNILNITKNVLIDNTPPQLSVITDLDGPVSDTQNIKLLIFDKSECTIYYSIDGGPFTELGKPTRIGNATAPDGSTTDMPLYAITVNMSYMKVHSGTHIVVFMAEDPAGNIDKDTYLITVTPSGLPIWAFALIIGGVAAVGIYTVLAFYGKREVQELPAREGLLKKSFMSVKAGAGKAGRSLGKLNRKIRRKLSEMFRKLADKLGPENGKEE